MTDIVRAGQYTVTTQPNKCRASVRSVSILILMTLTGCTTPIPKAKALPDSIKSDLNTVAVTAVLPTQAVTVWRPSAKAAARDGATTAMEVATVLTMGLWPIAFYFAGSAVVPTVGVGIGLIVAAIKAPPQKEVEKIEAALRQAVRGTVVANAFRDTVIAELREINPGMEALILHPDLDRAATYQSLAAQGVGAVLELEITSVEIDGPWGSDPRGNILIAASARLIRTADGVSAYSQDFEFAGNHNAGNWFQTPSDGYNNHGLLQAGVIDAAQTLARDIARALFATGDASTASPSSGEYAKRVEEQISKLPWSST